MYSHIKCSFGEKAIFEILFESSSDCVDFMHFTRDHYFILIVVYIYCPHFLLAWFGCWFYCNMVCSLAIEAATVRCSVCAKEQCYIVNVFIGLYSQYQFSFFSSSSIYEQKIWLFFMFEVGKTSSEKKQKKKQIYKRDSQLQKLYPLNEWVFVSVLCMILFQSKGWRIHV